MRAGDGQQGASGGPQSWLGVISRVPACGRRHGQLSAAGTPAILAVSCSLLVPCLRSATPRRRNQALGGDGGPAHKAVEPASSPPASGGVPVVHPKLADVSGTSR